MSRCYYTKRSLEVTAPSNLKYVSAGPVQYSPMCANFPNLVAEEFFMKMTP